jgi:hypothetical protein
MASIQYSETLLFINPQNQDDFSPDFEGKDDDSYSTLQNPTKAPIISKDFLKSYTGCLKCAMILGYVSVHVQFISNHGMKNMRYKFMMIMDVKTAMAPQELLKHLKDEGDFTDTAIYI